MSYWYHPPRRWKFLAFNQQVNLAIHRRFKEEGIDFALPASTMRLMPDQDAGGAAAGLSAPPTGAEQTPADGPPADPPAGDAAPPGRPPR